MRGLGFSFDAPVFTSVDPWALAAVDRRRDRHLPVQGGMLPVLGACSLAGIALRLGGIL